MSGGFLTIRNWDTWQSYRKDRQLPPWIKLHRQLLRDLEWIALTDAQRGQLVSIWMLAADKNGRIPDDAKLIQKMCHLDKPPDLNQLIELGFVDARPTPRRRRRDAPEEEEKLDKKQIERAADTATKRAVQIPSDWKPKDETISDLKTKGFQEATIWAELEKFLDHHRARGNAFKDFDAAFRNWMRKSEEFAAKALATTGARKNGSGWYIKPDSEEYHAWMRHANKISDYKLQGRLKYGTGEILVPTRWPSR